MIDRVPPHHLEAEQSVLSAICMDNEALDIVMDMLVPGDFYLTSHQIIFQAMCEMMNARTPIDLVTLSDHLDTSGKLDHAGGPSAISDLSGRISTAANVEYWARIVKDKSLLRETIKICSDTVGCAMEMEESPVELIDRFQASAMSLSNSRRDDGVVTIQQASRQVYARLEEVHEGTNNVVGIPTGINSYDLLTGGLRPGEMVILAARPSMGKSALALNISRNVASRGEPVVYVSTEMTSEVVMLRLFSIVSGVTLHRYMRHRGSFTSQEWVATTNAVTEFQEAKLSIADKMDVTELTIRNMARRQKRAYGGKLGAVIIDHIGHLHYSGRGRRDSRDRELSEISRAIKGMAKELDTCAIVVSQLNRDCEKRENKRPTQPDLRDSGSLEQDADMIMFLYREGVYNSLVKPTIMEGILAKNRNGPAPKTFYMDFDLESQRITDAN